MTEMKSLTLNDKKYDCFVDSEARALAAAAAVIKSASGESITVSDSGDNKFYNFKIYGKTIPDGTPSPETSADLVSVGDSGSVTVSVVGKDESQSMIIATPNGLVGIPVASGGNYTDANGQQWVCDEIDLNRGVYVQRVYAIALDTFERWSQTASDSIFQVTAILPYESKWINGLCTHFRVETKYSTVGKPYIRMIESGKQVYFEGDTENYASLEDWTNFLMTEVDNGTPVQLLYVLATPIETPLPEEEIAAYNALRTYRGGTTVSNDASAYMELDYVMDAKTYIDLMLGATPVRLAEVNLAASQWTGSNGLYSQVVTISGVTEYTKVDLLPSVEQLAIFHNKNVTFVTENEDGVVTVYAIGDKPTQDYTMQVQMTEVVV